MFTPIAIVRMHSGQNISRKPIHSSYNIPVAVEHSDSTSVTVGDVSPCHQGPYILLLLLLLFQ